VKLLALLSSVHQNKALDAELLARLFDRSHPTHFTISFISRHVLLVPIKKNQNRLKFTRPIKK
jgi:hypothetical protein